MTMATEHKQAGASGDVRFFEDTAVAATKLSPILESLRDAHSVLGEELRLLRAKVRSLSQGTGPKCLALSSALPGEGKSTISLALAGALAREAGCRVLLIEADLRRPGISRTLGLSPAPGLAEWLNGALDQAPVRLVQPGGFFLMVAGEAPLERPEDVGSHLMDALLRSARKEFDFVLLDSPPVLPVSDAILMQDLVDGFLIVARSRRTPKEAILEALGRLRADKIVGIVLNDHREYRHSYTSSAYQRYGMVYGPRSSADGGRRP